MNTAAQKQLSKASNSQGRRERNKEQKRLRIVSAARNLFRLQGFAETTTLQIAEAADIGTGTLFLYARSKEDLLIMVFKDEMMATAQAIFGRLTAGSSAVDQMMSVFEQMVEYHARDPELSQVLLKELVMPSSKERRTDIAELMDVLYNGLADIARSESACLSNDPDLTARSAFALYYFALFRWIGGGVDSTSCLILLRKQLHALLETGE